MEREREREGDGEREGGRGRESLDDTPWPLLAAQNHKFDLPKCNFAKLLKKTVSRGRTWYLYIQLTYMPY